MGLTALDILVLVLVGGGAALGLVRGFVTEVLSLFAWIAGVLALKFFQPGVAALLARPIGTHAGAQVLAFALVFGIVFFGGKLVAAQLGSRTRQSILGPLDRVLGLGFGALKGLILATLLFLAANLGTDTLYGGGALRPDWMRSSRTFPLLNATSRAIVDFVAMRRKAGAHPGDGASPQDRTNETS